jgi:hypothetical protein
LSKRLPKSYLKPLPRKEDVMHLLGSCVSPGAKLAVGLAAFSGLRPGQVRELVLSNLVEFSTASQQFSRIPSQIELRNQVTWRRYYTFLSTSGCKHLLDDLSTRSQVSSKETVVTKRGFAEAGRVVRAAKVKWFELRHFFLRFYSQEPTSGSKPRVEVVYYRVIGKSDEKLVIKRTRKNHLPYHLRRFGKNDPALK